MDASAKHPEVGIQITPEAVEYARKKRLQVGQPQAALRVGVRGGGCAGLTYVSEFTDDPPRGRDVVYDFDDIQVYVDNRSLKYLDGSVLRYESTLMYQGFKWENPQQDSSCGCGLTFSIKKAGSAEPETPTKSGTLGRRELKTI